MKLMILQKAKKTNPAFTLLLASLISSILLAIAIFMINIAQKEIVLASVGRDSQYAFYAADSGAECALYWDFRGAFNPSAPTHDVQCSMERVGEPFEGNANDLVVGGKPYGEASTMQFEQRIGDSRRCVKVEVVKEINGDVITTQIDSRGYNMPCSVTSSPRLLERAVRITY